MDLIYIGIALIITWGFVWYFKIWKSAISFSLSCGIMKAILPEADQNIRKLYAIILAVVIWIVWKKLISIREINKANKTGIIK